MLLTAHLFDRLPLADGDALAQVVWAPAVLGLPPPDPAFMEAWFKCVQRQLPAMQPPALTAMLTGLVQCRAAYVPPVEVMEGLTVRAGELLGEMTGSELAAVVAGLADLRWRPSDAWLQVRGAGGWQGGDGQTLGQTRCHQGV